MIRRRGDAGRPAPIVGLGLLVFVLGAAISAACGKKGDPLPPVRLLPGAVTDAHAALAAGRVEVRARPPAANQDGSRPSVAERLEFYAVSVPAGAPPPTAGSLITDANLVLRAALESPPRVASGAEAPPLPSVVFLDQTLAPLIGSKDAPVRYYVVVAVTGRNRRGPPSPVMALPLAPTVPAPAAPALTYDAATITITLPAVGPGDAFLVDEVVDPKAVPMVRRALTPAPIPGPALTVPVAFGTRRCFSVRLVRTTKLTTIEGPPGAVACETPVDRFGPPAPTALLAIAGTGGIDLNWTPVDAADLAGYIVLRGERAGGTLQALMTTPLAAASYRDSQVTAGVTYVYAVVAIDTSGNASPQSTPTTVIAR